LLIGCCDSRVDPAMLLGCDPGDIFTVRNVANLVPPANTDRGLQGVLAAIQFAVEQLQVSRVIVLGHAHCGGIRTLMDRGLGCAEDSGETDYLKRWMDIAEPARRRVLQQMPAASAAERRRACEQASILISLRNLEDLPFVRRAVQTGALTLHGWYFDLVAGALLAYSARADAFLPIVCPSFTELA
jgi:carbonic anhydrase